MQLIQVTIGLREDLTEEERERVMIILETVRDALDPFMEPTPPGLLQQIVEGMNTMEDTDDAGRFGPHS